ncbi:hypothetical protein HDV05_003041 [Chytridiales sp. JEL 0842]|nr:hypothetical protein HDV05_003041 [Chytridiales sp. JEL 0842]
MNEAPLCMEMATADTKRRLRQYLINVTWTIYLSSLSPNTKVILNGGQKVAYLEEDGSFSFTNVPSGSHLLEVLANGYVFDKIRVSVMGSTATAYIHLDGTSWTQPGPPVALPLVLPARAKVNFFMKREGFSVLSLFQNPMMLMMGGSLLFFFVFPKMLNGMDPEALKELQEKRGTQPKIDMPDVSEKLANFFAPTK